MFKKWFYPSSHLSNWNYPFLITNLYSRLVVVVIPGVMAVPKIVSKGSEACQMWPSLQVSWILRETKSWFNNSLTLCFWHPNSRVQVQTPQGTLPAQTIGSVSYRASLLTFVMYWTWNVTVPKTCFNYGGVYSYPVFYLDATPPGLLSF